MKADGRNFNENFFAIKFQPQNHMEQKTEKY